MYLLQGGNCKLCGLPFDAGKIPQIDHDHKCCDKAEGCPKCVRGLVHTECNNLLGIIERRNITTKMLNDYFGGKES